MTDRVLARLDVWSGRNDALGEPSGISGLSGDFRGWPAANYRRNQFEFELARRFAAEDAAFVIIVMKLRAADALTTSRAHVNFGSGEHPDQRGSKVNP